MVLRILARIVALFVALCALFFGILFGKSRFFGCARRSSHRYHKARCLACCLCVLVFCDSASITIQKYSKKIRVFLRCSCFFNVLSGAYGVLIIPKWLKFDSWSIYRLPPLPPTSPTLDDSMIQRPDSMIWCWLVGWLAAWLHGCLRTVRGELWPL